MKTSLHETETSLRKFPTNSVIIYMVAHVLVGLLVSFSALTTHQWHLNLFMSIDAIFPTFRTWFVHSKDPIGCKVMLLLWWLVFIPWGLIWLGRFTSGFKVLNRRAVVKNWPKVGLFLASLFFVAMLSYGMSFMDQSENMASASQKYGRSSVVPFLINKGPEFFAIFLAGMSLIYVMFCSLMLMFIRDFLPRGFLRRKPVI